MICSPRQVLAQEAARRVLGPFTGLAACGQAGPSVRPAPREYGPPSRSPLPRTPPSLGSRSHGSELESQLDKPVINIQSTYELLRRGVWTTCAFYLCTDMSGVLPGNSPTGDAGRRRNPQHFLCIHRPTAFLHKSSTGSCTGGRSAAFLPGLQAAVGPPPCKAAHPWLR
jgi:hypothetical protein